MKEYRSLPAGGFIFIFKRLFRVELLFDNLAASAWEDAQHVQECKSECPEVKIHDAFLDVDVEVYCPDNDQKYDEDEADDLHCEE